MRGLPTAADAEAYIRDRLPLASTIDVGVSELGLDRPDERAPVLTAPLTANANHLGTAFGGSMATLAILAGWVAVHYRLISHGYTPQTVIQRTAMEYLSPARSDLTARCSPVPSADWTRLVRSYERHGRGRVMVHVELSAGGLAVARFEGVYVAIRG